jgi:hypothetical protein
VARVTADSGAIPSAALRHMAESPASIAATFAGRGSPEAISWTVSFTREHLNFQSSVIAPQLSVISFQLSGKKEINFVRQRSATRETTR